MRICREWLENLEKPSGVPLQSVYLKLRLDGK